MGGIFGGIYHLTSWDTGGTLGDYKCSQIVTMLDIKILLKS